MSPVKYRLPILAQIAYVSISTGWLAALYGAVYIYAAADFALTGSFWIFGWPFVGLLGAATVAHMIIAGAGLRTVPSPLGWVGVVNRVARPGRDLAAVNRDMLAVALKRLPEFPAVSALSAMILASAVTGAIGCIEWWVTGTTRNVAPIVHGGIIATLLYGAIHFTVSDLLVSRTCRRLRQAALERGLDPYSGPTLHIAVRVATLAAPTVLALVIAQQLSASAHGSWIAETSIVFLGSGLCVAIAWLQAFAVRSAAEDLGEAASRLTSSGEPARLVTGSNDTQLVDMARAFNAAADRVDRSLAISAARYAALFEGAGDAILLVDAESGIVLEANRRAQQLTGRGQAELVATRFDALFEADAEAAANGGAHRVLRPDGSGSPVDVALSTVAVGDWRVVQAILHDVGQLTAQNAELRAAERRLTEADRLKTEFMGMMSHELRTPLNVFVGYTEMLLDASRERSASTIGEHRHVLERLLESAHNLTTLVEDTLSVLRLEGGRVLVHPEAFSLEALFAELRSATPFLPPSSVREQWTVEPGLPRLETWSATRASSPPPGRSPCRPSAPAASRSPSGSRTRAAASPRPSSPSSSTCIARRRRRWRTTDAASASTSCAATARCSADASRPRAR
jgi:PAS domain S-box-containing protein